MSFKVNNCKKESDAVENVIRNVAIFNKYKDSSSNKKIEEELSEYCY